MEDAKPTDKVVFSYETSSLIFGDLDKAAVRAAQELGCSTDDIVMMNYEVFPQQYMETKHRDVIVKKTGIVTGSPFATFSGNHSKRFKGYGLTTYSCRLEPEIKYVLFTTAGSWDPVRYIFVRKGQVFRLKRLAHRLEKMACEENKAPVLAPGILDELIRNTIGFLGKAREIEAYGVRIRTGLILDGPPGNGKTMACRYIQRLCTKKGIRWGVITSSAIDKAYNENDLSSLFSRFTVSFFDDIDISYLNRKSGNGKLACALLTAMDGMSTDSHLIRIFTTNERVSDLDPAFTRPGRIDRVISIDLPDRDLRARLVAEWPESIRQGINVEELIDRSRNYSFAELEAIRTFLVTNYLLGPVRKWDLDKAFDEFEERKQEAKTALKLGFNATKPSGRVAASGDAPLPPANKPAATA